jgi:hypothetical protein
MRPLLCTELEWQARQFFSKMGATSALKLGVDAAIARGVRVPASRMAHAVRISAQTIPAPTVLQTARSFCWRFDILYLFFRSSNFADRALSDEYPKETKNVFQKPALCQGTTSVVPKSAK